MRVFLSTLVAGGLFAGAAAAEDGGRYVSVGGGWVGASDYQFDSVRSLADEDVSLDPSFIVQGAYGLQAAGPFRFELAGAWRKQDARNNTGPETGSASVLSLDLNGYYDLPVPGPVRPYVGAGAGIAQVSLDDGLIDDSASVLQLQLMAGASVKASERVSFFAEARYQRVGTLEVETSNALATTTDEFALKGLAALAGVRVAF